ATGSRHPLSRLRDEFDALFDQFFGRWPSPFGGSDLSTGWGFDVEDTDKEVVVTAEAPGFEPKDFDIQLTGNTLTVKAERKQEVKEKGDGYGFSERRLHRSISLPEGTLKDKVEATYRNGILEVRLPKSPEAQAKRITVKS